MARRKKEEVCRVRTCGECVHCIPYMKFNTLTVKGRRPTMGTCPYREFKVLLSEDACDKFKERL